jgi:NAD(P)H-dependent FMN reductase
MVIYTRVFNIFVIKTHDMSKIIAFSGSNSKNSINQKFVEAIANEIKSSEVEVINLRDYEVEIYGIDKETESGFPKQIEELHELFNTASGFIVSTPEHNGSMPAALKNIIDWLSRKNPKVFREKPTLFFSTSPGPRGGVSALEHMVNIMPYRGANIVGHMSLGSFGDHFENGRLDSETKTQIARLVSKLEEAVEE